MNRKDFLKHSILVGGTVSMGKFSGLGNMNTLSELKRYTDDLPKAK